MAVAHLLTLCEPEASEARVQMITLLIASYDYTRAELLLAMREVPRDPEASHNYGRGFNLADVERVIRKSRQIRGRLQRPVTAQERDELLEEHPNALSREDFACCESGGPGERRYLYVPDMRKPGRERRRGLPRAAASEEKVPIEA